MLPALQKDKKEYVIASAICVALALAFALGIYAFRGAIFGRTEVAAPLPETPTTPVYRHPLTGARVEAPVETLPQVYAVMIDDSVDAWPQSGIDDAFMVIEAPVEAGIPRLEAFFYQGTDVPKIGPVRSARPYFVDWAYELDAMYVHVGGSDQALDLIGSNGTFDLNQFWNGDYFWRSTDRFAPHNVYTSTELLGEALANAQERERAPERLYGAWMFVDAVSERPEQGADIMIDSVSATYRVDWKYDETNGRYQRFKAGLPDTTLEGDDVWADNIAVVVTSVTVVDNVGRRAVVTVGEGQGYVFQDGRVIEATWKKLSTGERLRFYDATGKEIAMVAGSTWIHVVPSEDYVVIKAPTPDESALDVRDDDAIEAF